MTLICQLSEFQYILRSLFIYTILDIWDHVYMTNTFNMLVKWVENHPFPLIKPVGLPCVESIWATFRQLIPKYYVAPFFSFWRTVPSNCTQFSSLKCTQILFWLNAMGHSKFHNTLTPSACYRPPLDCWYSLVPASAGGTHSFPPPLFFLSWTEEPAKADTCAQDRRALQQLAPNMHIKLWPDLCRKKNIILFVYTFFWHHVGLSVCSWCDGSLDRSFMGWTHWAISRSGQCSTTGVTKAVVYAILSVGWCI